MVDWSWSIKSAELLRTVKGLARMPGDRGLGAVLRDLRESRRLTLATVGQRAGCAESLISYVESGRRNLQPWLAARLDEIYSTGGVVIALLRSSRNDQAMGVPQAELLTIELPEGGNSMPLSRRELLAALGVGIASGPLLDRFEQAIDGLPPGETLLGRFEQAYMGFQAAARRMPPTKLIDGILGKVALLDGLRRRVSGGQQHDHFRMQARYAESLSWLSEEAGDLSGALYWIDRASQWAQAADWSAMAAYGFVRRSMMVVSFADDGHRAIDNASAVLSMREASPRVQGLAAKQMAFGYALAGNESASRQQLDTAMDLLSQEIRPDDAILGQRSVVDDDLFTIFRTTCDIYLGRGEQVVPVLEPRLASLSASSARTAAITRAKLARAYANAGQPHEAANVSLAALDDIDRIGSLSARSELRRAVPVLSRWHGREEIQTVLRRLRPSV